jgi:hypothetical protein
MDLIHYGVKVLMDTNVVNPISVRRGKTSINMVFLMDDGVCVCVCVWGGGVLPINMDHTPPEKVRLSSSSRAANALS